MHTSRGVTLLCIVVLESYHGLTTGSGPIDSILTKHYYVLVRKWRACIREVLILQVQSNNLERDL